MPFYFHILTHFTLVPYPMPWSSLDSLLLFIQLSLSIEWDFSLCMTSSSQERWNYILVCCSGVLVCKLAHLEFWKMYMLFSQVVWLIYLILLQQVSEFDLFTLDDIDSAFQRVTRLTYSQNHHLSGKHLNVIYLGGGMHLFHSFTSIIFPPSPLCTNIHYFLNPWSR